MIPGITNTAPTELKVLEQPQTEIIAEPLTADQLIEHHTMQISNMTDMLAQVGAGELAIQDPELLQQQIETIQSKISEVQEGQP